MPGIRSLPPEILYEILHYIADYPTLKSLCQIPQVKPIIADHTLTINVRIEGTANNLRNHPVADTWNFEELNTTCSKNTVEFTITEHDLFNSIHLGDGHFLINGEFNYNQLDKFTESYSINNIIFQFFLNDALFNLEGNPAKLSCGRSIIPYRVSNWLNINKVIERFHYRLNCVHVNLILDKEMIKSSSGVLHKNPFLYEAYDSFPTTDRLDSFEKLFSSYFFATLVPSPFSDCDIVTYDEHKRQLEYTALGMFDKFKTDDHHQLNAEQYRFGHNEKVPARYLTDGPFAESIPDILKGFYFDDNTNKEFIQPSLDVIFLQFKRSLAKKTKSHNDSTDHAFLHNLKSFNDNYRSKFLEIILEILNLYFHHEILEPHIQEKNKSSQAPPEEPPASPRLGSKQFELETEFSTFNGLKTVLPKLITLRHCLDVRDTKGFGNIPSKKLYQEASKLESLMKNEYFDLFGGVFNFGVKDQKDDTVAYIKKNSILSSELFKDWSEENIIEHYKSFGLPSVIEDVDYIVVHLIHSSYQTNKAVKNQYQWVKEHHLETFYRFWCDKILKNKSKQESGVIGSFMTFLFNFNEITL